MALGFGCKNPSNVGANHETGYSDVATKELVGHRHEPYVFSTDFVQKWRDHLGAIGTGENTNRSV